MFEYVVEVSKIFIMIVVMLEMIQVGCEMSDEEFKENLVVE